MRAAANRLLPDTCDIYQRASGQDAYGGASASETLRAAAVPCRLAPVASAANVEALRTNDQRAVQAVWTLTLPYDQAIAPTDRVVVSGQSYEVVTMDGGVEWRTARRVLVERRG